MDGSMCDFIRNIGIDQVMCVAFKDRSSPANPKNMCFAINEAIGDYRHTYTETKIVNMDRSIDGALGG